MDELPYGYIFMIVMIITFSWVLIDLWGRWLNNLLYISLSLDEKSTSTTLIVALSITLLIVTFLYYLPKFGIPIDITPDLNDSPIKQPHETIGIEFEHLIEQQGLN